MSRKKITQKTFLFQGFSIKNCIFSMSFCDNVQYVYFSFSLKGQCHEIFDPRFFHQTMPPGPLIHGFKPF
jgi:hypothetical protein